MHELKFCHKWGANTQFRIIAGHIMGEMKSARFA